MGYKHKAVIGGKGCVPLWWSAGRVGVSCFVPSVDMSALKDPKSDSCKCS